MESVEGCVEKIKYRNIENGYTVLNLITEYDELVCVGNFAFISEGEYIKAQGEYTSHPIYGEQLLVKSYDIIEPKDAIAMERYLASGAVKGIKEATARKIIKKFGEDTFRIIEEEPERLAEIKGISEKKARDIGIQFEEKRDLRQAMLYLQKYGISTTIAVKIYNYYGYKMYEVLRENPYKLAEDITGIGFKLADDIAYKVGIDKDSDFRVRAGIMYCLNMSSLNGHTFLLRSELFVKVAELLGIQEERMNIHIDNLVMEKKIIVKKLPEYEEDVVYSTLFYYMELGCARMLIDLNIRYEEKNENIEKKLEKVMENTEIVLDEQQKYAVVESVKNAVTIITGGPGTGKTTTINTIIQLFESQNLNILLAAPTGRAAKRMSETTGHQAQTIHRMLELSGGSKESDSNYIFERNADNPLEADVIIIDEMSMVDINLMNALLKAITVGTRLIMVGDINQLPSVGPGNVLKDMINSHIFNVVMLTRIFRQASQSDIIVNAHKINYGESIELDNKSKDFFMLKRDNPLDIQGVVVALIRDKLPKYVKTNALDIQVLTPMRKGELGVERMNEILQQYLNPPSGTKREKQAHGCIFREHDKVMQIKNNYQLQWEIRNSKNMVIQSGLGVFNGDSGIIKSINDFAELVEVEFDEGRIVEYKYSQLDELELSYAITIHKSQGSEYPAVIIPLLSGPKMLMTRNLLYTAVTRAKSCVALVGRENVVESMIQNASEQKRYTSLDIRLKELVN